MAQKLRSATPYAQREQQAAALSAWRVSDSVKAAEKMAWRHAPA